MKNPPHGGLVPISGSVSFETRAILQAAGDGNISEGLRRALALPTTTLSGAVRVMHPALLLPDPEKADGPAVLAMPGGIIAHGIGPAGLIIDAESDRLLITGINREISTELNINRLATLAARFLPAVLACCCSDAQADEFGQPIGCGLLLQRLSHGLIEIVAEGQAGAAVVLPLRHALQLAAELSALLSRRVAEHQDAIAQLSRSITREEAPA